MILQSSAKYFCRLTILEGSDYRQEKNGEGGGFDSTGSRTRGTADHHQYQYDKTTAFCKCSKIYSIEAGSSCAYRLKHGCCNTFGVIQVLVGGSTVFTKE